MRPTLRHGQLVIFMKQRHYKSGQVVLYAPLGSTKEFVKRLSFDGDRANLSGDNHTDTLNFSHIVLEDVRGALIWPRLKQPI